MRIFAGISRVVILSILVLGSGCALMKPTDTYVGMDRGPRPYSSSGPRDATVQRIKGQLTIDEAIRVALANNPGVAAMGHDAEAIESQRQVAISQKWPSLHMKGGYNRYLDNQRLLAPTRNGEPGVFNRDMFASEFVVTMPLFTGGRIASEIKAAELLQKAAQHRLARTRDELVFNVCSTFYSILAQRRVIESLEFSRKTLQEHLKRVKNLIAAQKAAKVDQLRTEVRLSDIKQRLVRERNVLAIQVRVLTNLLGLEHPDKPLNPAGKLSIAKAAVPETAQVLRQALDSRPDYLAARAALEAQAKAVDVARAAQWPTVAMQGEYGGRWAVGTDSSGDFGQLGVGVDIPIFEDGRIQARIRQARFRLMAARERLRQLELKIRLDIETAVLNIGSAQERVKATETAIEQAKESLRIEREKYDLGKGAITNVLDAQSALVNSQTNYYRALADYNVALAQLKLATGDPLR